MSPDRALAVGAFFLYGSWVKPKIIVIVGPTASGKSAYAVKLATKLGGEVISADSRQVYKGLNIGTGKITKKEMKGVPHHLLDVADPKKVFTAHDYVEKARPILEKILAEGKTPIICGGTGFYIDALLGRIVLPDVPANRELRERLKGKSASQLFAMLQKLDPRRAKEIDRHNPVRLIRAIEIAKALGKVPKMKKNSRHTYSPVGELRDPASLAYAQSGLAPLPYSRGSPHKIQWIGMKIAEIPLREKIHARLLARMKYGMVTEAMRLHNPPTSGGLSYKRMSELGLEYRYLALLLQKKITKKEMLEKLEIDIRKYAKRQMTYWKRNTDIIWFPISDLPALERHVRKVLHT